MVTVYIVSSSPSSSHPRTLSFSFAKTQNHSLLHIYSLPVPLISSPLEIISSGGLQKLWANCLFAYNNNNSSIIIGDFEIERAKNHQEGTYHQRNAHKISDVLKSSTVCSRKTKTGKHWYENCVKNTRFCVRSRQMPKRKGKYI